MEDKLKFPNRESPTRIRRVDMSGILWVGSEWNWCMYPSLKVSGYASLISMIFSCLCCCHKYKSCECKVKLRQASCKIISLQTSIFEAPKLAVNKIKVSIKSQKLGCLDFRTSTRTSIQQLGGVVFYIW